MSKPMLVATLNSKNKGRGNWYGSLLGYLRAWGAEFARTNLNTNTHHSRL